MPEQPYTEDDLRAEAARQHDELTVDTELEDVGERMVNAPIASRSHWSSQAWWHSLSEADQATAQEQVHSLITGAADVSEWAVYLGADGVEPAGLFWLGDPGARRAAVMFAFATDMSDDDRQDFVRQLTSALAVGSQVPELPELRAQLDTARAALKAAQAAIARVRYLCDLTIGHSMRVQAVQQARDTLAALTDPVAEPAMCGQTAAPRLLDCELCYEENGEEVHPHPECTHTTPRHHSPDSRPRLPATDPHQEQP